MTTKEKQLTGYPSIDKPWLKYYSEEAVNAPLPECTMYEYLWKNNQEHPEDVALVYFGRKITYGEMFNHIEKIAGTFWAKGIRKGDIVSICSVSTPEVIYAIYALNKIGATVNILEPRNNAERIEYYLNLTQSKYLLMLDICFPKIDAIIQKTTVEEVVVISPLESASPIVKIGAKIKGKKATIKKKAPYITWKEFEKCAGEYEECIYEPGRTAVIVYTGGTTGIPKGVMLSDVALNTVALQMQKLGDYAARQKRFLNIMPPFIAYGITCGIHMPLCSGMRDVVIPNFTPDKLAKLVLQYKPSALMGVPSHYGMMAKDPLMKGKKLDFLEVCGAGGDAFVPALEESINQFFKEHEAPYKIAKGYGMTEMCSAVTACFGNYNKLKSAGIPLCKNVVAVFKPDTDEELPYNTQGEICFLTPTRMEGYYGNEAETLSVLKKHSDGKVWVHTKDIGYVDEDGFVFIINRVKRMIIRADGHNVFPSAIEEVINSHEAIAECAVVGIKNAEAGNGQIAKAFMVLKEDYQTKQEQVLSELQELLTRKLPERDTVEAYQFVSEIPLTPIGKVNYRALEEMG